MIQLNSSLLNPSSLFGAQDAPVSAPASSSTQTTGQTTGSFQSALSAALSATLQEFGINPNQVTLSIAPVGSATAATAATQSTAATPAIPAGAATPANNPFEAAAKEGEAAAAAAVTSVASVASAPTTPATPASSTTPASGSSSGDSTQSFDDAYWAAQPPAVQALRNVNDYLERTQMAANLASQGYKVDVPIMVWGWDPAKVTAARQSDGYTWVPSAGQADVAEAPGIKLPGLTAYDPNNPPPGSIAV